MDDPVTSPTKCPVCGSAVLQRYQILESKGYDEIETGKKPMPRAVGWDNRAHVDEADLRAVLKFLSDP